VEENPDKTFREKKSWVQGKREEEVKVVVKYGRWVALWTQEVKKTVNKGEKRNHLKAYHDKKEGIYLGRKSSPRR